MVAIDLSPDPKGVPVGVAGSVNISVYRTLAKRERRRIGLMDIVT
jgi:hypothetical protein